MEPLLGQIQAFGFDFAPLGWEKCEGQLLAISQNTPLFALLGTMYGGDGRTTFGLPDLRERGMIGSIDRKEMGGLVTSYIDNSKPTDTTITSLKLTFCICVNGMFPSRN